ncbi:tRNA 2-thiouridine(34) synthase MnmA [Ancylomarina longa]|uniref:tRNA-specific 2-thiouridylase MnmA n=1 Tax=Ancylomarina longa TaxID=2487017 RepID=A0A434AGS9_9BACT|nr:tRNA 2-thiouridine(34) synthase MnmA [Ancylomarina longa]RUT73601.1 tRNA 2-thiouridine(34) synthase MnmA [Ancylomarina longa]
MFARINHFERNMIECTKTKRKVVLGMSGGTDSSVSAILLKEQGFEVIGVSLWFYNTDYSFNAKTAYPEYIQEAKALATRLKIAHHVIDARREFREKIIQFFLDEYLAGRTPSPCIHCNPQLKWKLLLEKANQLECDFIATGHYIQILKEQQTAYIHKGFDPVKDQSYFLWNLPQEILQRTITPLGKYTKHEVREIAKAHGFPEIATKKESMGVCFMDHKDYRDFLKEMIPNLDDKIGKGAVLDTDGNHLGWHDGYPYYTVGQKRGLDLEVKSGMMVSKICADTNTLILAKREDLNRKDIRVYDYYFHDIADIQDTNITTVVRGLGLNPDGLSRISLINEKELKVELEQEAWAIAPGQPVAFYIGSKLIGGGFAS